MAPENLTSPGDSVWDQTPYNPDRDEEESPIPEGDREKVDWGAISQEDIDSLTQTKEGKKEEERGLIERIRAKIRSLGK